MARIKMTRDIPAGGWRYIERETGAAFEATSLQDLVDKVTAHRRYKGLPTDGVQGLIEAQICLSLTNGECQADPGEDYRPVPDLTQKLTTDMAVAANKALIEFVKGGFEFADAPVALERAKVCRTCPFNKPASGCSCHAIYRMIELMIPAGRRQPGISVCMACGCSLQAKVNLPDSVITASLNPGQVFPPWCWQNRLLPLDGGQAG